MAYKRKEGIPPEISEWYSKIGNKAKRVWTEEEKKRMVKTRKATLKKKGGK